LTSELPTEARAFAYAEFEKARPPKYRGLERAARIGQIIAEDSRDEHRPLVAILRDVIQANALTFDPPYAEAKLQALALARLRAEGVDIDE